MCGLPSPLTARRDLSSVVLWLDCLCQRNPGIQDAVAQKGFCVFEIRIIRGERYLTVPTVPVEYSQLARQVVERAAESAPFPPD